MDDDDAAKEAVQDPQTWFYLEVHGTYWPIMTVLITHDPLVSPLKCPIMVVIGL